MIKFAHICPTQYLQSYAKYNGVHLILAHLVEQDEMYANFYASLSDNIPKIMDNGGFEMYKQGRPLYPSEKLIEMGHKCKADYIVMTDYPAEYWVKTKEKAEEMIPLLKNAGFKTFYCPQSEIGDVEGLLDSIEWGLDHADVDLIGISILSSPNAFGVERNNNLQRYMSRYHIFNLLSTQRHVFDKIYRRPLDQRFHCLGMVDGPNEIQLLSLYHDYIYSWDSSAAIWSGLNNIRFDNSPTGLINGKFEKEVDFNINIDLTDDIKQDIMYNIIHINSLL